MKKKDYLLLFCCSLIFFSVIALIQKVPGYMDAEYYYGQSIRIVENRDLQENFIWNYLNDPVMIPTEGFSFWMPLTSIFASMGLWVFGSTNFYFARTPFIFLAALIPVFAAYFAYQFLPRKWAGWMAGGLAIFSCFYLPYITITDSFTPYMFLGGLFFFILSKIKHSTSTKFLNIFFTLLGIIAGLMSLTRSDGILWLVAGCFSIIFSINYNKERKNRYFIDIALILIGFCLIMTPWFLRNYFQYQSIFPKSNGLMLWLNEYDDLFVYPSQVITFSRWIETGIKTIILDRLIALNNNMQTFLASGGAIILMPLIVIGFWKNRKENIVRINVIMLLVILGVMSVLFPYAGERGGFFHSLSSIQILLWSMVPSGLNEVIRWGCRRRNWKIDRAWNMFGAAILLILAGLSAFNMVNKIQFGVERGTSWNNTQKAYIATNVKINEIMNNSAGVVMTNNPPGYTLATGRKSVMIPSGDVESVLSICEQFKVKYVIVNDERQDFKLKINENQNLAKHFSLFFEGAGNQIYEYQP